MPRSVVLTLRKARRVRQPGSGWGKGGPAPGTSTVDCGSSGCALFAPDGHWHLLGQYSPDGDVVVRNSIAIQCEVGAGGFREQLILAADCIDKQLPIVVAAVRHVE